MPLNRHAWGNCSETGGRGTQWLCRAGSLALLASFLLAAAGSALAHPGSGIMVGADGSIYFVDTGEGVWKVDGQGKLARIHTLAYHWMALDEKGHFANSRALGDFDGGSFQRITPSGAIPALIVSSDYPIAVGHDGGLYYVPYRRNGPRELIRRMPDGRRTVFATLPEAGSERTRPPSPKAAPPPANVPATLTGEEAMLWVNGIAAAGDALYVTDNDAILRVDRSGTVSAFREGIRLDECADPLPKTPRLPYLRGLAVGRDGTIYAAANGCRAVIAVPAQGPIRTTLQAEAPWSPTGVAVAGPDIYVLEYLHTSGDDRREWTPRVRRSGTDGTVRVVAAIKRRKNGD